MQFDYTTETITPDDTDVLTIGGSGALELPFGSTVLRPGSVTDGALRYNTDIQRVEGLYNGIWVSTSDWSLVTNSPTSLSGYGITDAVSNNLGTPGIVQDTFVNRPVTPGVGTLFVDTTNNRMQRWSGVAWETIGAAGSVTSVAAVAPIAGFTISGSPITSSGTFTFALANDLASVEGLATTGVAVRTSTDTWTTRSIAGTAGRTTVTNGSGIAGDPTIDLATTGAPGTYGQVTTDAYGRVTSGGTNTVANGGTGLTSLGTSNQVLGANAGATALEYKTLTAGSNITITHGAGTITIAAAGGGGTPGGVNTNVQFNNAGVFGGSSAFNFVAGANPRVDVLGTALTTQLTIGGTTQPNNASLYIENVGDATSEGLRCYFRRSTAGISGWITYDYDQNTPNIRLTDEDDDSPYVQFNVIGGGTYAAPGLVNLFGGRGPVAGATTGFAWRIGQNTSPTTIWAGAAAMELDSQWLRVPVGTTAARPVGVNGMLRYNTDLATHEGFAANTWSQLVGVISKTVVPASFTTAAGGNYISETIPGGTLGANRLLRIRAAGTWNNASGTTRTVTMSVSYGGTTMWSDTSTSLATGTTTGWNVDVILSANNSVTAQVLTGLAHIGSTGGVTNGITGDLAVDEITALAVLAGTAAVNSAAAQTLNLGVSFNGGGITWLRYFFFIELL